MPFRKHAGLFWITNCSIILRYLIVSLGCVKLVFVYNKISIFMFW